MTTRLIANKYREGKAKRTLKRELKVLEIVKGEANIAVGHALSGRPWFSDYSQPFRDGSTDLSIRGKNSHVHQGHGFRCIKRLSAYWIARKRHFPKVFRVGLQFVIIWSRKVVRCVNAELSISSAAINSDICPVLKHGPRSLTYVRVCGLQIHVRNESDHSECPPGHAAVADLDPR